jgi:hypothetical protein
MHFFSQVNFELRLDIYATAVPQARRPYDANSSGHVFREELLGVAVEGFGSNPNFITNSRKRKAHFVETANTVMLQMSGCRWI